MVSAPVTTRRWNDPAVAGEGRRILVTRYRPRGVRKADEPWDEWWPELGPSAGLLAAFHGKDGPPIEWASYRARFLAEMAEEPARFHLAALAGRLLRGEPVALLCSSACTDPARCHRELLRGLLVR